MDDAIIQLQSSTSPIATADAARPHPLPSRKIVTHSDPADTLKNLRRHIAILFSFFKNLIHCQAMPIKANQ